MITNLRYHIDGNKILVRWNYEDVDISRIVSTCRLVKRINGEVIEEYTDINWNNYHSNGGGCRFSMSDMPSRIELFEQVSKTDPVVIRLDIAESPTYNIKSEIFIETINKLRQLPKRPFRKAEYISAPHHCKLTFTLRFPDTLTDDEANAIEGWIIRGVFTRENGEHEYFFWNSPFKVGENTVVLEEQNVASWMLGTQKDQFRFEIVPEIAGTKYDGMFTMNSTTHILESRDENIIPIDPMRVKPKINGYYPVVCPFCLRSLNPTELPFRAVSSMGDLGFPPEQDEAYKQFRISVGAADSVDSNMGKVLTWEDDTMIQDYALSTQPKVYIPYDGLTPPEGIVVAVHDTKGNLTNDKICPHCHHSLPIYSGLYPHLFISMMGYTGSGKTVYMAKTVHMLREQLLLPGYGMVCDANNNAVSEEYLNKYAILSGVDSDESVWMQSGSGSGALSKGGLEALLDNPGSADSGLLGSMGGAMDTLGGGMLDGASMLGSAGLYGESYDNMLQTQPDPSAGLMSDPFAAFGQPAADPFQGDLSFDNDLSSLMQLQEQPEQTETEGQPVQKMPDATAVGYTEPCIYQLRSVDAKTGLILSFFDFPGEALDKRNNSNIRYQKYFKSVLECIDGMIFLFDPLMLSCIQKLDRDQREEFARFTYVTQNEKQNQAMLRRSPRGIIDEFKHKFASVSKLNAPVVFAISKSDAIRDHIPDIGSRNLSFMDESANGSRHDRTGIDLHEIEQNSQDILAFQEDNLLKRSGEAIADDHIWMCVSATGIAPKDGSMKGRYGNPVRMMEPLEWMLYKNQERSSRMAESAE